jgi:hypothetical protein
MTETTQDGEILARNKFFQNVLVERAPGSIVAGFSRFRFRTTGSKLGRESVLWVGQNCAEIT